MMKIKKSSRHSKIVGDFAERLVLYWLSKYGFECAYIDHVGIDIIARNPLTGEKMGISVKSRSRTEGTEDTPVSLSRKNFKMAVQGIKHSCKIFDCKPYFAIVVDARDTICVLIMPLNKLLKLAPKGSFRMRKKDIEVYRGDRDIKMVEFSHKTLSWW